MKSKSPFAMKSPLLAYKSDMRGNYANPKYVKEEIVGVKIGEALTKAGTDIFSGLTANNKTDSSGTTATHGLGGGEYKGFGGGMKEINLPETPDVNTNLTNPNNFSRFTGSEVPDLVSKSKKVSGSNLPTYAEAYKNDIDGVRTEKGYKNFNAYLEDMKEIKKGDNRDIEREAARAKAINGSPNKLIGDTMDPYGQPQRGNRDFTFNENEIAPGTLGSQASMGIQKEIFGGGQAQIAAEQLQTPLYDKGHGVKQAHTHPSKTTTKMKPDGEYPGARYVKGDLVDQDDLLDKTKLDAHIATQVQSDKKGTFIKEMPDTGPGSNIETSKGFGKKIRLESMGRSSYTSNMKDQLDPHDFLFKNTPKNNKKK